MKKLCSKFLLLILLSFSFVQKVLAEEIATGSDFGLAYSQSIGIGRQYPIAIIGRMVGVLALLPLALFSTATIVTFLYLKLRKKDTTKIKSLFRLGGLSLLTIVFLKLTLFQLKNLEFEYKITHYFPALIKAMLNDKISLILTSLSILSLLTFTYYLLRTIILYIAQKIRRRKIKIIP